METKISINHVICVGLFLSGGNLRVNQHNFDIFRHIDSNFRGTSFNIRL